jgi:hypothetical protein
MLRSQKKFILSMPTLGTIDPRSGTIDPRSITDRPTAQPKISHHPPQNSNHAVKGLQNQPTNFC